MDVSEYLERIDYHGPLEPNPNTLRELQLAHLRSVPFENLSIHWNEPIVLDDSPLFEKIVRRRRGGFCYELNGLFAWLLAQLGFDVVTLSARVFNSEGEEGPEFDHMTLLVSLEERWLADVGFGDSFLEPLRLDERNPQKQGRRDYVIQYEADRFLFSQREDGGPWINQYSFSLQPYKYGAFNEMCIYQQTSPQSHFTKKRLCTLLTPDGRITLSDLKLVRTSNDGVRQESQLASEDEFKRTLQDVFEIA